MTHFVEIAHPDFEQIVSGELSFWIMKEKYPVQTGERIIFQETDEEEKLTGKEIERSIGIIWGDSGLKQNFVAVNLK